MRVLVTGSSGRIGRAIAMRLCRGHEVAGLDRIPSSTTQRVGDIADATLIRESLRGMDAVVHAAALHAPHVGHAGDEEFERVNVHATRALAEAAAAAGVRRFVFTSTTALYGAASTPPGAAGWIDEGAEPRPATIYHRTKLAAERLLEEASAARGLAVTVLRMSRCFPEPAPLMAAYRLHRGIDARDVADAHAIALESPDQGFRKLVISAATPFTPEDLQGLKHDAPSVLRRRAPELVEAFARRGWHLPPSIDRVYCPALAMGALGWSPRFGFGEVLRQLDRGSPEVLPPQTAASAAECDALS